ncbi:MAG: division/cell wall cluster transcriptional repressor MraZ [Acidimicrobiia bacterium]
MFLGEDRHNVDGKGRLVLPSRYRSQLSEQGCVIAKGQDGHLMVFPTTVYQGKADEANAMPNDKAGRRYRRILFGGADQQVPDSSGRLLVRSELREYAGLEIGEPVAVIGVYDHIELWNAEKYDREREIGDAAYLDDDDEEEDEELE